MFKLKRLITIIVIIIMGLTLVSCGDEDRKTISGTEEDAEGTTGLNRTAFEGDGYSFYFSDDWTLRDGWTKADASVRYLNGGDIDQNVPNVGFRTISNYGVGDLSEFGKLVIEGYRAMDGVKVIDNKYSTLGSYDTFELELTMETFGVPAFVKQIIINESDKLYIITIAQGEEEEDDVCVAIDELISSFEITK